jgi:hypothetical protein
LARHDLVRKLVSTLGSNPKASFSDHAETAR